MYLFLMSKKVHPKCVKVMLMLDEALSSTLCKCTEHTLYPSGIEKYPETNRPFYINIHTTGCPRQGVKIDHLL